MNRKLLFGVLSVFSSSVAMAESSTPATYIMQVTSDLGCSRLSIELVSDPQNTVKTMNFSKGAFAAVELSPGLHTFGDIACTIDDEVETLDVLNKKMLPLRVEAGRMYYGGRLIIKTSDISEPNTTPESLANCTRNISRIRGDEDNECRDGVGVSSNEATKTIDVYMPEVRETDINRVRSALSATQEQLIYLPLKVKA